MRKGFFYIITIIALLSVWVTTQKETLQQEMLHTSNLKKFDPNTPIRAKEVNYNFRFLEKNKQDRIQGGCLEEEFIQKINDDGSVVCSSVVVSDVPPFGPPVRLNFRKQLHELEVKNEALRVENTNLSSRLTQIEEQLSLIVDSPLKEKFAQLESEITKLQIGPNNTTNGIMATSIGDIETTVSALSDNVSSNSQSLDQLQEDIDRLILIPDGGISNELLQRFLDQLQALQVKTDDAWTRAQNAEALSRKEVDLTAIQSRINQNRRSIGNLNDLAESLNVDVVNLQERVTLLEGHEHAIETGAAAPVDIDLSGINSEIANVREFSLLLRRRQLGLEARAAALEAEGAPDGDVAALVQLLDDMENRLSTIEESLASQ